MREINIQIAGVGDFFTEEAYKVLRTNLLFSGKDKKVIYVTSSGENEGKSTVSMHIARSFSDLGQKVLLIDADMRKSVMLRYVTGTDDYSGLSECLTGQRTFDECLCHVANSSFYILFAGKYPPNPAELLNTSDFEKLLADARAEFDHVIVDTPPIGLVIDAAIVAPRCDGGVLIATDESKMSALKKAVVQLNQCDGKLLGVVRNRIESVSHGRAYYRRKGKAYSGKKYAYIASSEENDKR